MPLARVTVPETPETCGPHLTRRANAWIQRRLGMRRPCGFKGTLLVLRKRNFAVDAFVQMDHMDPKRTTAILDTGAGPSVVREDVLPAGWEQVAARAPRSTHVCDASGQMLRTRGIVELSVIVDGKAMPFEFLVVRALSVPVILGMDFQRTHVKAIYPGTETVLWTHGFLTYAKRTWDGKDQEAQPVKGNPARYDPTALCLAKGVTLAPRSVQAVYVRCGTNGRCLLYERPQKLAQKGIRLHNALAHLRTRRDARLYLTNLTDRPVNLPKNFAVGIAVPYDGPAYEVPLDELPGPCEGASPVDTLGGVQGATSPEAPSSKSGPNTGHDGNASRSVESGPQMDSVDPDPMPKVAWHLIPSTLHSAVRDLLDRYKGLWDGQLGRLDVTPHRITLTEGARPIRSQPYRTGLHHRDLIRDQVAKQTKLGVIEPSQAEWSFPVVLVPKPDGTPRFCVDYRRLKDLTVRDTYPLPRMDDCIDFLGEATVFSMLDATLDTGRSPWPQRIETRPRSRVTREPTDTYGSLLV